MRGHIKGLRCAGVVQRDPERLAQMRCHTALPGHPYTRFPWGNKKSLWDDPHRAGVDVRKDLIEYYRCVAQPCQHVVSTSALASWVPQACK